MVVGGGGSVNHAAHIASSDENTESNSFIRLRPGCVDIRRCSVKVVLRRVLVITGKTALLGIIVIINGFRWPFVSVQGSQEQQYGAECSRTFNDKCVTS